MVKIRSGKQILYGFQGAVLSKPKSGLEPSCAGIMNILGPALTATSLGFGNWGTQS